MKKIVLIPILLSCIISNYALANTNSPQKSTQKSSAAITPLNRIAAIVNNEVITQHDLNKHIHLIKAQLAQQGTPLPEESVLDKQVLNQLISQTLQLQMATQNNIAITSQQIDTAIDKIAKNDNATVDQLYENAKKEGLNKKTFREEIKIELTIQQLQQDILQSRINITQEEIDNYLHNAANDPKMQAQYHLKDILVALPATPTSAEITAAQQRANNLIQQLQHGTNFEQLAVAQSSGQKALQGGDLGWRSLGELPEEFAAVVSQLQEGQVSQPIRTANGFHILKLVTIQGVAPKSNAQQREKVANILFQQKSLDALETWISQLRAQAYVQIMPPYNS